MLEIRLAASEELDAVLALNREVQALHAAHRPALFVPADGLDAAKDAFADMLDDPDFRIWLALHAGAPVGYAMTEIIRRPASPWRLAEVEGRIQQISVAQQFRRQGVGRALITRAKADLAARGVERVTASYWAFNGASAALFASAGFGAEAQTVSAAP